MTYGTMTAEGKRLYSLVDAYGLGEFYQAEVGNVIIEPDRMTVEVARNVFKFLAEHTEWIMGYEDIGDGEQIIYVAQIAELN